MTSTTKSLPVTTTWDTLQQTRNEAAIQVLSTGLKSDIADLRHASLRAISGRKEHSARVAIILHWHHYDERDIEFLRGHQHGLSSACSHLLHTGSYSEKHFALAASEKLDFYEIVEQLLDIVLGSRSPLRQQATDCLLAMCERWGQQARKGKTSRTARRTMVDALHGRLVMFHEHQNTVLLDAWLKLAHWEDSAERGLIADPRLDAYWAIMERLSNSDDPAVLQLLAGYVGRHTTPSRVAEIIVERKDSRLMIELAKLADDESMPVIVKHLSRLPPMASIENLLPEIDEQPLVLQHRLWVLVAASSEDLTLVLQAATKLAAVGDDVSRHVAAEMLWHCRNNDLQVLVPALQSEQTNASAERTLGSLLREIASWVSSSTPVLQTAARRFLDQFTVVNLLTQVRVWPAPLCGAMAEIVRIVEPEAAEQLSRQLRSPAPKRRLDALQVTRLLDATHQVSEILMDMLDDPRLAVRVSVIDLLGSIQYEPLLAVMPQLLEDASTDIQDAGRRALRRLKRSRQREIERSKPERAVPQPEVPNDLQVVGTDAE